MADQVARLRRRWSAFQNSLLFYPAIALALALLGFVVTTWVDRNIQDLVARMQVYPAFTYLLFAGNPEAARSVLAAIATMWATITGVVYSVTLVTVQLSATKYSAEVIPRFERDRVNRLVLALYTATVAYALLVLKTVRVEAETSFAPVLGVNVAILLALASLVALGVFISNLVAYMRPKRFVDDLAKEITKEAQRRYEEVPPERSRALPGEDPEPPRDAQWRAVRAPTEGYVARVNPKKALKAARGLPPGALVALRARPGDAAGEDDALWDVALPAHGRAREDALKGLSDAADIAESPTVKGDPAFGIKTLGEIGVTTLHGSTDLAIAEKCMAGLFHVARWEAGRDAPPRGFEAGGVRVDLRRECLLGEALRQAAQVHDAALSKGLWVLTETLAHETARLLERLAQEDRTQRFRQTLAFAESALAHALKRVDDDDALARAVESYTQCEGALRRQRRYGPARELRSALEEAATAARRERHGPLGPRTTVAIEKAYEGAYEGE